MTVDETSSVFGGESRESAADSPWSSASSARPSLTSPATLSSKSATVAAPCGNGSHARSGARGGWVTMRMRCGGCGVAEYVDEAIRDASSPVQARKASSRVSGMRTRIIPRSA